MLGQIIKQWQLCPLLLCEPGKKTAKGQAGHVLKAFHSNTVQSHQLKIIRPFWRLGFFCHGYNYRFSTELGNLLLNKRWVNRFYKISQSCSAQTLRILLWSCQALDFSWCGIGGKHTRLNNDTKTREDGAIVQCSKNTIMYVYKIPLINETQIKHLHGFCKLHLIPIIPHLFFSLFSPINGLVKGLLLNSNENWFCFSHGATSIGMHKNILSLIFLLSVISGSAPCFRAGCTQLYTDQGRPGQAASDCGEVGAVGGEKWNLRQWRVRGKAEWRAQHVDAYLLSKNHHINCKWQFSNYDLI